MSPILKSLKISFFDILTIHKLDFDLQSLETDKKTDALTDKKTDKQTENWKKLT